MNIDAHFHAWQIARGDYGWLTPALAPIYRDVEVADWWQQAKAQAHVYQPARLNGIAPADPK